MHKEKTLIIGHRGAAALCPENTLESFHLAFDTHACDMIEFDIHLSADGIPVIIHDETLERTTNGSGRVEEHSLEELRELDAGFQFDPLKNKSFPFRDKKCRIPTLDEVFQHFPNHRLALEIKSLNPETVDQVLKVIEKHYAHSRIVVGSLHDRTFQELKTKQCGFKLFTSKKEAQRLYLRYLLGFFDEEEHPDLVASLPVKTKILNLKTKRWMHWLRQKKITVYYWTVNEPKLMKELAEKGADGIMSDNPQLLRSNL